MAVSYRKSLNDSDSNVTEVYFSHLEKSREVKLRAGRCYVLTKSSFTLLLLRPQSLKPIPWSQMAVRSDHRVCILGSRREEGTRKGIPFPFRNSFQSCILLPAYIPQLQLNLTVPWLPEGIGKESLFETMSNYSCGIL